jgi:ubiquitin carboxyl-terminal hydrolase 1
LELLTDCICRKCSMLATHRRLIQEADKLAESIKGDPNVSASRRKRAREAKKLEARVKAALDEGRIEDELKGVKMEKVFSKASTKQAMIARVSFKILLFSESITDVY